MFVLNCKIEITREGKEVTTLPSVNEVVIKHSLFNLSSTAIIKLPLSTILKYTGEQDRYTEELKKIKKNDKVVIHLGYNNELEKEFTGYVKRFNYSTPGSIECENKYLKIRANSKGYKNEQKQVKLKDLLETVFPEVEIAHCADLTIKNISKEENTPGEEFLRKLKKDYNLCIFFDLDEKLHIGQPTNLGLEKDIIKYKLGFNAIKNDELKYEYMDDKAVKVKATCYLKDGEQLTAEAGEGGGEEKAIYVYDVEDKTQLEALAKAELQRYKAEGFRGKLTAFLQPYAFPGMIADIDDPIYTGKKGRFLIEDIQTTYSKSGGRRQIGIGIKMPEDS